MDTLILMGLLCVLFLILRDSSRRSVLTGWFLAFLACGLLLRLHITSGLGLGLTW
ncbi:DUF5993 family protein [Nocardia sp. NPDC005978]|uniref:DUF5993 family protein n=1 Tax=unclassified Nocardia TaxID=2637762 RepID=UPI0033A3EF25